MSDYQTHDSIVILLACDSPELRFSSATIPRPLALPFGKVQCPTVKDINDAITELRIAAKEFSRYSQH